MEKYQRHIGIAIFTLAVVDLAIGWIAVANAGFGKFLAPIIAASIGFVIGTIGGFFRKPWVFGGGMVAVFYFCPSPAFPVPLIVGLILLAMYAVAVQRNTQGG